MRADRDGERTAALADVRDAVEPRLGLIGDDLELLSERVEALGRHGTVTTAEALAAVREALEPRLAELEQALAGLAERVEALVRDEASTTTSLLQTVQAGVQVLDRRLDETASPDREQAVAARVAALLAERDELLLRELAAVREQAAREREALLEQLGRDRDALLERTRADRSAVEDLLRSLRSALESAAGERATAEEALRTSLGGVQSGLEQVRGTIGGEVQRTLAQTREELGGALRAGLQQARTELEASVSAGLQTAQGELGAVASGLVQQVRGELREVLEQVRGELRDAVGEVSSGTAVVSRTGEQLRAELVTAVAELRDQVLAGTDASAARAAADTTRSLADTRDSLLATSGQLRDEVLGRLQAQTDAVVEALRATAADVAGSSADVGQRLGVLTTVSEEVASTVAAVHAGITAATDEMAAELRARADEGAAQAAGRLVALEEQVSAQLALARESWDARAQELLGSLTSGLAEIAEEVDIAATTTRDSSQRVTALAELSEVQRAEVAQLLRAVHDDVVSATQDLRGELLARTAEQLSALEAHVDRLGVTVGAGSDELGGRLDEVASRLVETRGSTDLVVGRLDEVAVATGRLAGTVQGFREEWPTRTYEVVSGARAVAEAVVLDVRAEVDTRLQEVRTALQDAVRALGGASADLDDGTDRLAQAGAVLVAYLEHRDRLLEQERDRVLHEVLDAFAAGLPARERTALGARVQDAVARRRDARDAERYREALGEPVVPTAELPDEVRALAVRGAAAPPEPSAPGGPAPSVDAATGATAQDQGPRKEQTLRPQDRRVPDAAVPLGGARRSPAGAGPAAGGGGRAGRSVVPGPGRRAPGAPTAGPAADRVGAGRTANPVGPSTAGESGSGTRHRAAVPTSAPLGSSARSVPGPGRARGRLNAMPQPPSVDVALRAAAPAVQPRSGGDPPEDASPVS